MISSLPYFFTLPDGAIIQARKSRTLSPPVSYCSRNETSAPERERILITVRVTVVTRPDSTIEFCSSFSNTTVLTLGPYWGRETEVKSLSHAGVSSAAHAAHVQMKNPTK